MKAFLSTLFSFFLVSCSTSSKVGPQSSYERFRQGSVRTNEIRLAQPIFLLDGDQAYEFLIRQIDSASSDGQIEIRQFYVRRGVMTNGIVQTLKKKLQQGTRIRLELDFMFAVSALRVFDELKAFPNFRLDIKNPPSASFFTFTQQAYGLQYPERVIDDVIDSNLTSLRLSLRGSRLEGAVDDLQGKPTPEILLGSVMKKLMSQSSWIDLLKFSFHMRHLSKRFHDKILNVRSKDKESYIIGGRGWADSFTSGLGGRVKQVAGELKYLDLDVAFEKLNVKQGEGRPALLYIAGEDYVQAARDFEDNLVALIESARFSLEIYTPYFTPTPRIRAALEDRARWGVKIVLKTNSLESSDVPAVAIYMIENLAYWTRSLGENFEFFTLDQNKGECYHGKLVIVDQETVWIGSGNWDFRSFFLDSNSFVAMELKGHPALAELNQKLADPRVLKWRKWSAEDIKDGHQFLKRALGEDKVNETLKLLRKDAVRIQL